MNGVLRRVLDTGNLFGLNLAKTVRSVQGVPKLVGDAIQYRKQNPPAGFELRVRRMAPMLTDYRGSAGSAGGHYFHQDLWAARKIYARRPARHIDIGSRIDGFIAHLLVFMDVQVIDILPMESKVKGLGFVRADATSLAGFDDGSIGSLSTLHAAEHFGLGRYSDPVDPWAHVKFMTALERVLAVGGNLYFSVPVVKERLEFNAHRVFSIDTVLSQFRRLRLTSFSYIDGVGNLHCDVSPAEVPKGLVTGCGLFDFRKE